MRDIAECVRYIPNIARLTKTNSFTHQGRIIYIVKKDNEGKSLKIYMAYDYKSRIQLGGHYDKDYLINFIKKQDLKVLNDYVGI